jgi:hypothetical protein
VRPVGGGRPADQVPIDRLVAVRAVVHEVIVAGVEDVAGVAQVGGDVDRALRPMLDRFGTDPRFRVILFTVDETVYSRELAPIAGTYPSVRLGAPWWFLDSPEGWQATFYASGG